jgi:hypothetical protein
LLDIARDYHARYGPSAPYAFARDLMEGDAARFKAGYTAANAALATQDAFDLTDEQTDVLREQLRA